MTRILGGVLLALALAGCSFPLASDDPPASRPTVSGWDEIEAGDPTEGGGEVVADAGFECLDVPEALMDWLGEYSWEYSRTRPAGAGKMVAAGGDWFIAAIPTTGDFDVKGWAWIPGDAIGNSGYPVARVMPLPANWDEIDPDWDEDHPESNYYKSRLPIEDGAYTAAMACLGG